MSDRSRPNILFIFTDQHKLPAVGCYGDTPCRTPYIDALAASGVRFQTAYTSCPVCTPARGTIMTGLYPHAHGMCCNVEDLGSSVHELADRPELLSRRLEAVGYRLGYTGKWHLGSNRDEFYGAPNIKTLPRDVGFEGHQFAGHGNGGFGYSDYLAYLREHGWEHRVKPRENQPFHAWNYGVIEGPVESSVPYFLAEHTIDLIDRFGADEQPFFIWHNFWGPHGPYFVPQEYYDLYRDVDIPEWPNFRYDSSVNRPFGVKRHTHADALEWPEWEEAARHYYAFASLIDAQIGRILDHLDATGQRDNTIVVFTADHGETLGTHGGLTDKGFHHFDEIQRIPLIVDLPEQYAAERLPGGTVLEEWASLVDIYPTLLDLAGVPVDETHIHGRSLRPLLEGHSVAWRDGIVVEFWGVNSVVTGLITLRKGRFKYGWNSSNEDDLYDLEADPHEMHNLVDESAYADVLDEMREALEEWMVDTGLPSVGYYRRTRRAKFPF